MADKAWKAIERAVAEMTGGVRAWDSKTDVDVLVPDEKNPEWAIEVKNLTAPTVADLERILAHNATKCALYDPPLKNALVVKRKAGPGKKTPFLAVFVLEKEWPEPTPAP